MTQSQQAPGPTEARDTADVTEARDTADVTEARETAISLVGEWLERAERIETDEERDSVDRLSGVVTDPDGVAFAMRFVDRVLRPESHRVAARQLVGLVAAGKLPDFLSPADKVLLRAGARLAPIIPGIVMPLAARRMRGLVGHLVVDAEPETMATHFARRSGDGFRLNVNLLGEAVLGQAEADRRHAEAMALLDQPSVDYVSVKVSAIVAQLNYWDWEGSTERVMSSLRPLLLKAGRTSPVTFINLDMEEYHDLELTMEVFTRLLDEPELHSLDAGIVLQAYLPDSFPALQHLVRWAAARRHRTVGGQPGGTVKIRLVKGANLAMERVEAALHDWEQAPYRTKAETDANYKRCLDWLLDHDRMTGVRLGVASHNLFDVAFAKVLAESRGVIERVEFEMLEGMAPSQARVVRTDTGGLLLYTPVVAEENFDVAISYLFRRLEENAAEENFIHSVLDPQGANRLLATSATFEIEAERFRAAVDQRWQVGAEAQRTPQAARSADRPTRSELPDPADFHNEPDTDPALPVNRQWAARVVAATPEPLKTAVVDDPESVERALDVARTAQRRWAHVPAADRRKILHAVADQLADRRGELITTMVHEADKTFEQADPEVSEAIDFARYYGDRALDLERFPDVKFEPHGVVAVAPPWNFPVAIATGGVTASLAAGNAVILKPAPEVPRCTELIVECCRQAGVPDGVLQFLPVPENEAGRRLITGADAVILTGAYETAELFRSWRSDMRLLAETSGKNAMVITQNADLDQAVADLVVSAFGHSGQKCSAASLAICVGDVYSSDRFRRQLIDAVTSLHSGPAADLATTTGPVIAEPSGKLARALQELDRGERWLVEPRRIGPATWIPGVKIGVSAGSWFHRTECFGPVLGLMPADDLDQAIAIQNDSQLGLTGGLHSLDLDEIEEWSSRVEVGNAYINKPTTGAIVRRQPFGGWKRSSVGPGVKAGGPNYVAALGTWRPVGPTPTGEGVDGWLADAGASDERAWRAEFSVEHDPTGLFCERNSFRYRPVTGVAVRVQPDGNEAEVTRVLRAIARCGARAMISRAVDEPASVLKTRLVDDDRIERIRVIGTADDDLWQLSVETGIHLVDTPVTAEGRLELAHYLKEQAISQTLHRYGNVVEG